MRFSLFLRFYWTPFQNVHNEPANPTFPFFWKMARSFRRILTFWEILTLNPHFFKILNSKFSLFDKSVLIPHQIHSWGWGKYNLKVQALLRASPTSATFHRLISPKDYHISQKKEKRPLFLVRTDLHSLSLLAQIQCVVIRSPTQNFTHTTTPKLLLRQWYTTLWLQCAWHQIAHQSIVQTGFGHVNRFRWRIRYVPERRFRTCSL